MADSLKNFRQGLGPTPERCGTPGLSGWGYPRLLSAESGIALALKYMEQATYTAARAPSSASFPNQRAAIMPAYAQRRKGNNGLSTIIFSRQFTWHTEQVRSQKICQDYKRIIVTFAASRHARSAGNGSASGLRTAL